MRADLSPTQRQFLSTMNPRSNPALSLKLYHWLGQNMDRWISNQALVELPKAFVSIDGHVFLGALSTEEPFRGNLLGATLNHILTHGSSDDSRGWFGPCGFKEIPDWFYHYARGGICFVDSAHRRDWHWDGAERWTHAMDGLSRRCRFCGERVQYLHREEKTRIVETWANCPQGGADET